MQKILSINIINQKDKNHQYILNPTSHPIIFYWDGQKNIVDEIFGNEQFLEYIYNNILNIENYSFTYLYYNDYDIEDDNIRQESLNLQDIYKLSLHNLSNLANDYIFDIMINLYKIVYKKEYDCKYDTIIDNIMDIYRILKNKYKERISVETLEQYVRSQLQQQYLLNADNIEYVLNVYRELIV